MLRPKKGITKYLLSSPATFMDELEIRDKLLLTHAFALTNLEEQFSTTMKYDSPFNRGFYIVALPMLTAEEERVADNRADQLIVGASVWYGKRFDNLGVLELDGVHGLPTYQPRILSKFYRAAFWNSRVRANAGPKLELSNFSQLAEHILSENGKSKPMEFFHIAGSFYLSALQIAHIDVSKAYLDLVMAIEVLSNFYEYTEDELYDDELKDLLLRMSETDLKLIKNRLFQVSRKYRMTFNRLLTDSFFAVHEATDIQYALKLAKCKQHVRTPYELRSKYVHAGFPLERFASGVLQFNSEVQVGHPVIAGKTVDAYEDAPTIMGLERMVRFALLRFLHDHSIKLHQSLNGPGVKI